MRLKMVAAAEPQVAPYFGAARSRRAAIRKKETSRARAEADKTGEQESVAAFATKGAPAKPTPSFAPPAPPGRRISARPERASSIPEDRKSVAQGKSGDLGGRSIIKQKNRRP